jgi:hypothetical protein
MKPATIVARALVAGLASVSGAQAAKTVRERHADS